MPSGGQTKSMQGKFLGTWRRSVLYYESGKGIIVNFLVFSHSKMAYSTESKKYKFLRAMISNLFPHISNKVYK